LLLRVGYTHVLYFKTPVSVLSLWSTPRQRPLMPSVALSCGDDGQLFSWTINNFNVPSKSLNSDENVRKWTENAEGLHDFDFCGTTLVVATESESLLFMYDVLEEMASSM